MLIVSLIINFLLFASKSILNNKEFSSFGLYTSIALFSTLDTTLIVLTFLVVLFQLSVTVYVILCVPNSLVSIVVGDTVKLFNVSVLSLSSLTDIPSRKFKFVPFTTTFTSDSLNPFISGALL